YEYVVSNLPWYIKWIATIVGYRGSEERAFEYLLRAAETGYFVKIDARVLLMILYVREKQHDYALEVAQQLHQRFPENFLFHLNQAQILERMERREEAAGVLTEIVRRAESGTKNYDKMPLGKIRYALGTRLVALGERESALHQFQEAARDPRTAEKERALSHLEAGQILDSMGEREEAVSHYEAVKGLDDVEDSHRVATEHLRTPYRPKR
ncbi:MAG TPA: hypothetical protein VEK15_05940, partial [Vicinamibacteria bacterium]|nr:hypothetical protein [Vicinamibacteria bacterium]